MSNELRNGIFKDQLDELIRGGQRAFWYHDFHGSGQMPSPKQHQIFEFLFAQAVEDRGYQIIRVQETYPCVYVVEPKPASHPGSEPICDPTR
jgi:hypothetical protein